MAVVLAGIVRHHGRAPVTWCQDEVRLMLPAPSCAKLGIDWERDNPVVAQAERLLQG